MFELINPFGVYAMKGIGVVQGRGKLMKIKQIRPLPDGIRYSLLTLINHFVLCPELKNSNQPSVVVCSPEGKFLEPIKEEKMVLPFSFPYSYIRVFIGKQLITVETHSNLDKNCSINLHKIIHLKGSIYTIETKTIWGGFYCNRPKKFDCFAEAINLAEERKIGFKK